MKITATDADPSKMRGHLNRTTFHDQVDVMVMEIAGESLLERNAQFAIAYLSRKQIVPGISGIQEVADKLKELDPDVSFFYHAHDWLIYIQPGSQLTLDAIMQVALAELSSREYFERCMEPCA